MSIRNIFAFEDEVPEWKAKLEAFPNHVPRFSTKEECIKFTKENWNISTNPQYEHLKQAMTTLIDWKQIETILIPKIEEYERRYSTSSSPLEAQQKLIELEKEAKKYNRYMSSKAAKAALLSNNSSVLHNSSNIDMSIDDDMDDEPDSDPIEHWDRVAVETDQQRRIYEDHRLIRKPLKMFQYIKSRLNLQIHRELSIESRINALKYLFFHMKCGIYIMIRNNNVKIFCPFANKHYHNTWHNALHLQCTQGYDSITMKPEEYAQQKADYIQRMSNNPHYKVKPEQYLPKDQWWANGNIICNMYSNESGELFEEESAQIWNDSFLFQLKDMFSELCRLRKVPDCEFFLNKRDYPQLKYNIKKEEVVEPYGFIYDRDDRDPNQDVPLTRHKYKTYLPVFSFYLSERFADIPMPPTEDWQAATGEIFPDTFSQRVEVDKKTKIKIYKDPEPKDLFTITNLKKFERPWSNKEPIAFFRGSATGGGVTCKTNQRLRIAEIDYDWSTKSRYNGQDKTINHGFPFLDAKIVGWNRRDKKISTCPMTVIHQKELPFEGGQQHRVPIYEQSKYKYILYIEGHCAACRYGFMMSLGSVILKVNSTVVADQMWYFPLLRNGYDHIVINSDYSNLEDVLNWCHNHDKECEQIAKNARQLYDRFISRDGILDYLQSVTIEMAKRWRSFTPSCGTDVFIPTNITDNTERQSVMLGVPKARKPPMIDFTQFLQNEIENNNNRGNKQSSQYGHSNAHSTTITSIPTTEAERKRKFRDIYCCVEDNKNGVRELCDYCKEYRAAEAKGVFNANTAGTAKSGGSGLVATTASITANVPAAAPTGPRKKVIKSLKNIGNNARTAPETTNTDVAPPVDMKSASIDANERVSFWGPQDDDDEDDNRDI